MDETGLFAALETEMKRGVLTLAILSRLRAPRYGYDLLEELAREGVEIEAGTLYPMLRRLEKQEVLQSTWDTTQARPRKYYVLSADGRRVYDRLKALWKKQTDVIGRFTWEDV